MMLLPLLLAAVTILPSDRMAMADRLFDRGNLAEAKTEYLALRGVSGVEEDELLYRLAEVSRAEGDKQGARAAYEELLKKVPTSRHATRARLMRALMGTEEQQKFELPALDADEVPVEIRAAALYHLGILKSDVKLLERCTKLDPKGRYASVAKFRRAAILAESKDPVQRRAAVLAFVEITLSGDKELARESLYMALRSTYADKQYLDAGRLAERYLAKYPSGAGVENVRIMAAWSYYLAGRWSQAESFCGDYRNDDLAYLRGACALASGDSARAKALLEKYLAEYPEGRYRSSAELPLARIDFSTAEQGGDKSMLVEAARRSALLSKASGDRLRYAWALENAGREREAIEEYAAIVRNFPKSADGSEALFRKAMIDARAARWSETELALAEVLAGEVTERRRGEASYWRGVASCKLGHEAEGVELLKAALKAGIPLDESREARLMIADADFKAGREAEAKSAYAKLVREGACERMSASRIRNVGRFLLSTRGGAALATEAALCGKALATGGDSPDWRQSGYALKGAAEEAEGSFTAAIESYRLAMKEPVAVATEDLPDAALALGILESKAGDHAAADETLRSTIILSAKDNARRVRAYLWMARNCAAWGKVEDARKYATIVTTLFDDKDAVAEAKKILDTTQEEGK